MNTIFSNLNGPVIVTNKKCLKLVEKLKKRLLALNSKPYGIFTLYRIILI